MILATAMCSHCKHFNGNFTGGLPRTCAAFPDRLPYRILTGRFDHRKPYPGDNGILFELKEGFKRLNEEELKREFERIMADEVEYENMLEARERSLARRRQREAVKRDSFKSENDE